ATVGRVVFLHHEPCRLFLDLDGPVQVERLEIDELGSVPLLVVLASRWLRRQLRRPGRLGSKMASTVRVLVTRGPKEAWTALVAAQMSSQEHQFRSGREEAAVPVEDGASRRGRREHELRVAKERLDARAGRELAEFMASSERLSLPAAERPTTSIVVVTRGRADLTLGCLRSIVEHAGSDAETVIVDNGSTDETVALLQRLDGATIVRNETNLGFVIAC